jgi:predicted acetyltransferase
MTWRRSVGTSSTTHGTIPYRYLDYYFIDGNREACFIRHCGHLAGFTMTRAVPAGTRDVAEFFVVAHHRRRGVGRRAAVAMFRRHPGPWVLAFDSANGPACGFWPAVAASVASAGVASAAKPASAGYPGTELRFEVA